MEGVGQAVGQAAIDLLGHVGRQLADDESLMGRSLKENHKVADVMTFDGKARLENYVHLAWILFVVVFIGLAAFDMKYLAPMSKIREGQEEGHISARVAGQHVVFWFFIGIGFNILMWGFMGVEVAIVWFNGYLLEFLLSMDNVFFFHVVFQAYSTPPKDLYKALFLGILGAVILRLLFYVVGARFFRAAFLVQFAFGLVLVWSGYKTATTDEDDDDPREMGCVKLMTRLLPIVDQYEKDGNLWVLVPKGSTSLPAEVAATTIGAADASGGTGDPEHQAPDRFGTTGEQTGETQWRGTMLLLVVCVLQVIDVLFAVDSVTAKIAEYDSTFINFTSSAFAMLCLRSLYFVFTKLLKYFHYLKYGVAVILVLIGIKLMITPWVQVPEEASMLIICCFFGMSILVSALRPPEEEDEEAYNDLDEPRTVNEVMAAPGNAPGGEMEMTPGKAPLASSMDEVSIKLSDGDSP